MAEKNRYFNLTVAGSAVVSVGAGTLVRVVVNKAVVNGVITLYDGANLGATTKIGTITFGAALKEDPPISTTFDCQYSNGLVINSTVAADITVVTNGVDAPAPLQVPGLYLWYDFADPSTLFQNTTRTSAIVADGNAIKGVTDRSGNGHHWSEATNNGVYKTGIQNGRSVLRTAAAGAARYAPASMSQASPLTLFVTWSSAVGAASTAFLGANGTVGIQLNTNTNTQWAGGAADVAYSPQVLTMKTEMWVLNGASSKVYLNGGAAKDTGDGGAVTWTAFAIGDTAQIDLAEAVIVAGAIPNADADRIGQYLAAKWRVAPWTAVS